MKPLYDEAIPNKKIKSFKSIDEIISDLNTKEDRPLSFSEDEMNLAKRFFITTNYFSFAIYRKLLPRIEGKQYSFSDCLELYNFNTFLRENLNHFTGRIELMFRATIIQQLCSYYEIKKKEDKIKKSQNYIIEITSARERELQKKIIKTSGKNLGPTKLFDETEKKLKGSIFSIHSNVESLITKYLSEIVIILDQQAGETIEQFVDIISRDAINSINYLGKIAISTLNEEFNNRSYTYSKEYNLLLIQIIQDSAETLQEKINLKKEFYLNASSQQQPSNMFKFESGELYLDIAIYKKSDAKDINDAKEIIETFMSILNDSKSDAIQHHLKKSIGVPLWVLMEEITYGTLYHFAIALEEEFQNAWTSSFNDSSIMIPEGSQQLILGWFRTVNFLRNECAHYNRLYGRYFTVSPPSIHKQDIKSSGIQREDNRTLFANMLTVKNLIGSDHNDIYRWNDFIEVLDSKISNHSDIIKLERMGFPESWKSNLIIYLRQ